MSDQYLWDKSGQPDPEVEELERVLSPLGEPRPLGEISLPPHVSFPIRHTRLMAMACAALTIVAIVWFAGRTPEPEWVVSPVAGTPRLASQGIKNAVNLRLGQQLETDGQSKAHIALGMLARLEVEPNTSLRVTRSEESEYRIALDRGKVHAVILAPPNRFYIDTPSAVAVDLGCTYTMEVDQDGNSLLHVTHGLVSLRSHGLASYIVTGAVCEARKNSAPGTPYFCDAPPAMIAALKEFDKHSDPAALPTVLSNARRKDSPTLWNLISRTHGSDRAAVVDGLANFAPYPAGVTREGALEGNQATLAAWWSVIKSETVNLPHP